ncbi:helix-turn-helix domain-containing protein, partial [Escherichia coli]|uniref:helix-turn-helix domain-containing protein n=1 Tax=Escherichia coli TaxID=562 RepID=UPI003D93B5DA
MKLIYKRNNLHIKQLDAFCRLNLQSKCNKKRSTHQLEYNFVSTQKPFPMMSTSYRHLTINEREKIMILLAQGKKQAEIAKALGRSSSTIS